MKSRLITSGIGAILGTLVFFLLGKILIDLIGTKIETLFCFAGAFILIFVFIPKIRKTRTENFIISIPIVFGTFIFISLGHGVENWMQDKQVGFEPIGMFLWATLATSWWLTPGVSIFLTLVSKYSTKSISK